MIDLGAAMSAYLVYSGLQTVKEKTGALTALEMAEHDYNRQRAYQQGTQELSMAFRNAGIVSQALMNQLEAQTGMYSISCPPYCPAPSKEYTCRYCQTKRTDKGHNCKNCAGLEVE